MEGMNSCPTIMAGRPRLGREACGLPRPASPEPLPHPHRSDPRSAWQSQDGASKTVGNMLMVTKWQPFLTIPAAIRRTGGNPANRVNLSPACPNCGHCL